MRYLVNDAPLPDPEQADARGLVAVGGRLDPARLRDAYERGIFPWYEEGLPVLWHSPDPRFVLPITELEVPRSLRKRLAKRPFVLTMDHAFGAVIRACAAIPRPGQRGTWITREMIAAYETLHREGLAHSVEAWLEGELVGGLYGVAVGGVFCGESMFARQPDASKIAFVAGVAQLARWGFSLVDCQVYTDHLARFGAREWPRAEFLRALAALRSPPRGPIGRWAFDDELAARWSAEPADARPSRHGPEPRARLAPPPGASPRGALGPRPVGG